MLALSLALAYLGSGPPVQRPSERETEAAPLSWVVPSECPDEAALRERVHALVPGLLDGLDAESSVEIGIEGSVDGYATRVSVRNEGGQTLREFVADDCETAIDAAALILAVTLDPVGVSVALRGEPEPEVEPEPEPESEPELPRPAQIIERPPPAAAEPVTSVTIREREPDDRPGSLRVGLRAFGGAGYGPTNTVFGTIGGSLVLLGPRWRASLGGLWALPRVVRVAGFGGGRFDGWAVFGRGCFVPKRRRLEFPLCGGLELGLVRGRGLDELPISNQASFLWLAPVIAQGLVFAPIDRVAIGFELDLAVPLNRGTFTVESTGVQQIAVVTVRGLAGVELRW